MSMLKPRTDFGWHRCHDDMLVAVSGRRGGGAKDRSSDGGLTTDCEEKTVVLIERGPVAAGVSTASSSNVDWARLYSVYIASRDTGLGFKLSQVGGTVTKIRVQDCEEYEKQVASLSVVDRVRVGDRLVRVGDQPVTGATTHAEVDAVLWNAQYPLVLTFSLPDHAGLGRGANLKSNRTLLPPVDAVAAKYIGQRCVESFGDNESFL